MLNVTRAAKVGVFLIGSAAAIYIVVRTVSKQVGSGTGYVVHAFLKDATGLAAHSRVAIAGIPVGTIDRISLDHGAARIDVRINGEVALYDNATLGKKSASLLGESVIVLTAGTDDRRKLKDGDEVHNLIEQATTDQVIEEVKEIADSIRLVANQLAKSIGTDKGGQDIGKILDQVAQATEALNLTIRENREVIGRTLRNVDEITTRANPEFSAILENVRTITADLRMLTAANGKGVDGKEGEIRQAVERINNASKSLESTVAHADSIAGRIDRGEGTVGRLVKDETLINEVQGVAEGVNDYVGNISRLQTVVGLRTDYNFLANTIKNYVGVRLQPREDKYYEIELINDPHGVKTITQTDTDTTNPTLPPHYRTVTTTTTDGFRFSLQFARRLGPFTGRFGVKESSGGVGLDIHLLSDRLSIVNDLFGFGVELQPRYRVSLGYEFIRRLQLMGGADYIFDPSQRDYFLGLQLRFNDEDLKTILPFAGGLSGAAK